MLASAWSAYVAQGGRHHSSEQSHFANRQFARWDPIWTLQKEAYIAPFPAPAGRCS